MSKARITKSFGPLSSGTRCEIVSHDYKSDPVKATVRVGPFNEKFYTQNNAIVKEIIDRGGLVDVPLSIVELSKDR